MFLAGIKQFSLRSHFCVNVFFSIGLMWSNLQYILISCKQKIVIDKDKSLITSVCVYCFTWWVQSLRNIGIWVWNKMETNLLNKHTNFHSILPRNISCGSDITFNYIKHTWHSNIFLQCIQRWYCKELPISTDWNRNRHPLFFCSYCLFWPWKSYCSY